MTKRAVWITCFIIVLVGAASILYRITVPTHFDRALWINADEPADYLARGAMMPDVESMISSGEIKSLDTAKHMLGPAERTADDNPNDWYYNLGGQHSSTGADVINYLELTFDDSGRLQSHRIMQESSVPPDQ